MCLQVRFDCGPRIRREILGSSVKRVNRCECIELPRCCFVLGTAGAASGVSGGSLRHSASSRAEGTGVIYISAQRGTARNEEAVRTTEKETEKQRKPLYQIKNEREKRVNGKLF
jgi:hypothetical protein